MTRGRLLVLLLSVLVGLGVGLYLLLVHARPSAITRDAAARIQPGMPVSQVEIILGGSPRDESSRDLVVDDESTHDNWPRVHPGTFAPDAPDYREWVSDSILVGVEFENGVVIGEVRRLPVRRATTEIPLEIVRRWLGL